MRTAHLLAQVFKAQKEVVVVTETAVGVNEAYGIGI